MDSREIDIAFDNWLFILQEVRVKKVEPIIHEYANQPDVVSRLLEAIWKIKSVELQIRAAKIQIDEDYSY